MATQSPTFSGTLNRTENAAALASSRRSPAARPARSTNAIA
jgi:hypothetical protein